MAENSTIHSLKLLGGLVGECKGWLVNPKVGWLVGESKGWLVEEQSIKLKPGSDLFVTRKSKDGWMDWQDLQLGESKWSRIESPDIGIVSSDCFKNPP